MGFQSMAYNGSKPRGVERFESFDLMLNLWYMKAQIEATAQVVDDLDDDDQVVLVGQDSNKRKFQYDTLCDVTEVEHE